jgi:hypothetical protein
LSWDQFDDVSAFVAGPRASIATVRFGSRRQAELGPVGGMLLPIVASPDPVHSDDLFLRYHTVQVAYLFLCPALRHPTRVAWRGLADGLLVDLLGELERAVALAQARDELEMGARRPCRTDGSLHVAGVSAR